ncbi:hypothetical protein Cgig2_024786 [Carnegiea gigantea]|uniref:Lysosomal Pro-X carboxypeptidase n=1 Tax=Carnegiea gigantea TaxID=171969 RepID=A0A9Q1K2Z4_9CARY|nr:hypothetical protein Cgig2_024786 [Carnegiea gigantea]
MHHFVKSLQFLPWLVLLLLPTSVFAAPMLSRPPKGHRENNSSIDIGSSLGKDVKILFYPQTLDHFNYQPESYALFNQKYLISFKHWGGAKAKSPIRTAIGKYIADELILKEYGQHFKALLHRFYGDSIPFGMSMKEAVKNVSARGYFSSAQAIADYAELILHLKNKLNAHYSPVIVFGGSTYPHIVLGALASSAIVRFFDNIVSSSHCYYAIVSKEFKSHMFSPSYPAFLKNLCSPLKSTRKLKDFLQHVYSLAAMYNVPTISNICDAINNGGQEMDVLDRVSAGILSFPGAQTKCQSLNWQVIYDIDTILGWAWQTCSEMVIPMEDNTGKDSMFPSKIFDLKKFIKKCKAKYNVMPRPHWVTTYYGGHDIQLILKRLGSNIIFSNGLKDPYSVGGIIAIYTQNGTHTMDLLAAQEDDPKWLVHQRELEVANMNEWLKKYYNDLDQS